MGRIPFHLRLIVFIMVVSFSMTVVSCSYMYLDLNHPVYFNSVKPCLPLDERDLQFHAFVAIVHSLDVEKWLLMTIDRTQYKIVARVGGCRFPTIMNIVVDSRGIISISRSSPYKISRVNAIRLRRVMAELEKTFLRYRCKSIKSLLEKVEKFWIRPRLIGSGVMEYCNVKENNCFTSTPVLQYSSTPSLQANFWNRACDRILRFWRN